MNFVKASHRFIICLLFVFLILLTSCANMNENEEQYSSFPVSINPEKNWGSSSFEPSSSSGFLDEANVKTSDLPEFFSWMQAGKFYFSFTLHLDYPGLAYDLNGYWAEDGDTNWVLYTEGDIPNVGFLQTRMMIREGISYFIDDDKRIYLQLDEGVSEDLATAFADLKLVESREEELNGLNYTCMVYSIDGEVIRFYMDGNKLYAIKMPVTTTGPSGDDEISGEGLYIIKEISSGVPDFCFEIPSDYTVLS